MIIPDLRFLSISAAVCVGRYVYAAHALTNLIMKIEIASQKVIDVLEVVEERKDAITIFGDAKHINEKAYFFPLKGNGICILDLERFSYTYIDLKNLCCEKYDYQGICNVSEDADTVWLMPRSSNVPFFKLDINSNSICFEMSLSLKLPNKILFSKDAIQYSAGCFYALDGEQRILYKEMKDSNEVTTYQLPITEKLRGFLKVKNYYLFYSCEARRVYRWSEELPNEIKAFYCDGDESLEDSFIRLINNGDDVIGLTVGDSKIYRLDYEELQEYVISESQSLKRVQLLFWGDDLIPSNFCQCELGGGKMLILSMGLNKHIELRRNGNLLVTRNIVIDNSLLHEEIQNYKDRRRKELIRDRLIFENPYINLNEFIQLL